MLLRKYAMLVSAQLKQHQKFLVDSLLGFSSCQADDVKSQEFPHEFKCIQSQGFIPCVSIFSAEFQVLYYCSEHTFLQKFH